MKLFDSNGVAIRQERFLRIDDIQSPDNRPNEPLRVLMLADDRHAANVVLDHIDSIRRLSRNRVDVINPIHEQAITARSLARYDLILIHYSIYVLGEYFLPQAWRSLVIRFAGPKVQIIQDEFRNIHAMKARMKELGVCAVFSSLEPGNAQRVYGGELLENVYFFSSLPGYIADSHRKLDPLSIAVRPYDVVYRGRSLIPVLGRHAQEKQRIGEQMLSAAPSHGLKVDIDSSEERRIYGDQWIDFLMSGRATLGVEGGVSIFDFDGSLATDTDRYQAEHPNADFEEIWDHLLKEHEGNIDHKTITPRIFEAIASKTALVLYPGEYRGVLKPNDNYLPLARDASNINEVIRHLKDDGYLQEMVDRTYEEVMTRHDLSFEHYVDKLNIVMEAAWEDRKTQLVELRRNSAHVLILYNATQTYTQTVFEHIDAFREYSYHKISYHHHNPSKDLEVDLNAFDAVVVHYTIRLPFDQLSISTINRLASYKGIKILIIQDEYDHTNRTKEWIKRAGFNLVFTVVPERSIECVYRRNEFPHTRFVSCLTGYVPHHIDNVYGSLRPPSQREIMVGYRGRPLPVRYGQLGIEKVEIGKRVKAYCKSKRMKCDIAWGEEDRIYGDRWYTFIANCRGMLGTESGSNVFDWSGTLDDEASAYQKNNPGTSLETIYREVISYYEVPGLMNQASPRIFEMIAAGTAMILFEGEYSGIIQPDRHFIALKKDFSNIDEVFEKLLDDSWVDAITERAKAEILEPGKYSYANFISRFDTELDALHTCGSASKLDSRSDVQSREIGVNDRPEDQHCTSYPMRSIPPVPPILPPLIVKYVYRIWNKIPMPIRRVIKFVLGRR